MCRYNRAYHVSGFSVPILNSISPFSVLLLRIKQTCFKACISLMMILKKNKSSFLIAATLPSLNNCNISPNLPINTNNISSSNRNSKFSLMSTTSLHLRQSCNNSLLAHLLLVQPSKALLTFLGKKTIHKSSILFQFQCRIRAYDKSATAAIPTYSTTTKSQCDYFRFDGHQAAAHHIQSGYFEFFIEIFESIKCSILKRTCLMTVWFL